MNGLNDSFDRSYEWIRRTQIIKFKALGVLHKNLLETFEGNTVFINKFIAFDSLILLVLSIQPNLCKFLSNFRFKTRGNVFIQKFLFRILLEK